MSLSNHRLRKFAAARISGKSGAIVLAVLATSLAAACGSKQDANEKNFGDALTAHLAKKGNLCLDLYDWTVDIGSLDRHSERAGRLAVLEKAGLMKAREAEIEEQQLLGGVSKRKVLRYDPTAEGKTFYREKQVMAFTASGKAVRGDLCYGQKFLHKVVKWDQPVALGRYKEVMVTYTYRVEKLADWAKSAEVRRTFPVVARVVDDAGKKEEQLVLKLTNQGWEAMVLY